MNKQPELHTTNLLMQPLSISFENAALQILRFSKIHENTHAWVIPLHTHPTIELHYILSGAGQIQIDDTLFHVETNDIYVTLPFVPHCQISSAADIMEEYCVECTLELPPAVKGETDPLASLRRFLSRQAFSSARAPDELLPLLQQLDQQAAFSDPQLLQTKLLYLRCLFDFLGVLSEARLPDTLSGKKRADTTALRIKSYLDVNFRTPFSAQDLYAQFFLSQRQLDRIFCRAYGMTVHAYLTELRLRAAGKGCVLGAPRRAGKRVQRLPADAPRRPPQAAITRIILQYRRNPSYETLRNKQSLKRARSHVRAGALLPAAVL